MQNFKGRVAVITCAASGIGFGLAERFASESMNLVLADVEEHALSAARERLRASVVEAIREERFYMLPHPQLLEQVRNRWNAIEADAIRGATPR